MKDFHRQSVRRPGQWEPGMIAAYWEHSSIGKITICDPFLVAANAHLATNRISSH